MGTRNTIEPQLNNVKRIFGKRPNVLLHPHLEHKLDLGKATQWLSVDRNEMMINYD